MKYEHDDRVKTLYDELKAQEALVLNLNQRTTSLLGTLHNMSTRIQTTYNNFLFHANCTVGVAHAIQLMFTQVHKEALNDANYYYIISECLRAMKSKFDKKLPSTDQCLRKFIGQTRIMWDTWNEITPLPKTPFIFDYMVSKS